MTITGRTKPELCFSQGRLFLSSKWLFLKFQDFSPHAQHGRPMGWKTSVIATSRKYDYDILQNDETYRPINENGWFFCWEFYMHCTNEKQNFVMVTDPGEKRSLLGVKFHSFLINSYGVKVLGKPQGCSQSGDKVLVRIGISIYSKNKILYDKQTKHKAKSRNKCEINSQLI